MGRRITQYLRNASSGRGILKGTYPEQHRVRYIKREKVEEGFVFVLPVPLIRIVSPFPKDFFLAFLLGLGQTGGGRVSIVTSICAAVSETPEPWILT